MTDPKPYRPANEVESDTFMEHFCYRCKRDEQFKETQDGWIGGCPIIAATMAYNLNDPDYPKEWITDDDGPRCTAFEEVGV
jgi:hypothetical protein